VLYVSGVEKTWGPTICWIFLKVYATCAHGAGAGWRRMDCCTRYGGQANGGGTLEVQDEIVMRKVNDEEPLALYVYKTMSDPFCGGGISFFKGPQRHDEDG